MYKDVATNSNIFTIQIPNTIVPTPTQNDYEIGFIDRYFTQRANDASGFVFEVSSDVFNELVENAFWKTVKIKWRLIGPITPSYKQDNTLNDVGVMASNKASISLGSAVIKNIDLYLPNLLQFYK